MKKYLVGGAVRDRLLGLPVSDRDWVVVGATAEQMLDAGYLPVGKDFPVFLHPQTKEEHALARTERKTAKGYQGFTFHANPDVTLEEDLARRDLTINAIAEDEQGQLIDPFNGRAAIQNRTLRHISAAFAEDPVRILRAARLHSRFAGMQFSVAKETLALMRHMVDNGEANALVAERVWQETNKALATAHPSVYFETLRECQALAIVFPEIEALFAVRQPIEWHPEVDNGVHTLMVLEQASAMSTEYSTRFAALCHDLGKASTPPGKSPSQQKLEILSADVCRSLCQRLRVPRTYRDLAILVAQYHTHVHRIFELNAHALTQLLVSLNVLRKPARFGEFLITCEADARGRTGFEQQEYPQADFLRAAATVFCAVDAAAIAAAVTRPEAIGEHIHQARVSAIKKYKHES